TRHNKLNRGALPEPSMEIPQGYAAPEDEVEEKLVQAWADVLGVEKETIGTDVNFFQLGGHSLNAITLSARIHKIFDVAIPLAELFKTPTIKGLAVYIKGAERNRFAAIEAVEEKEVYTSSSTQKRLYLLQQIYVQSTGYNIPRVLTLEEKPGRERLQHTFTRLIRRHESFRTSFEMIEENLAQRIHREVPFHLEYYESPRGEVKRIITDFIRPFHLSRAPLIRAGLIIAGQKKCILMVDMHHIIADGLSMDILVKEFNSLYQGKELTPLRLQYKDFSQWQNSEKEKERLQQQESYWLETYREDIPVLDLPSDYPRPVIRSFAGSTLGF
ncbi:MAG: hypothetical protein GY940_05540, partial [bacterium]|nr:hypothetical protein [bacterium]